MKIIVMLFLSLFLLSSCAGNSDINSKDLLTLDTHGVVRSQKSGLMWAQHSSKLFSQEEDAVKYAENLDLGGYSDWRIPTKAESHDLYFSVDFSDSRVEDLGMRLDGSIWIYNRDGALIPGTWDAGDTCCIVREFKNDSRGRVRAVRP